MLRLLAPEFEFRPFLGWGDQQVYRGHEGWRRFWRDWEEPWDRIVIDIERVEDHGQRVLALVHVNRIGRLAGARVSIEVGHIWTLREGVVTDLLALPQPQAIDAVVRAD